LPVGSNCMWTATIGQAVTPDHWPTTSGPGPWAPAGGWGTTAIARANSKAARPKVAGPGRHERGADWTVMMRNLLSERHTDAADSGVGRVEGRDTLRHAHPAPPGWRRV